MSNEKKQEIIDRADFDTVVKFAIKRYSLIHRIKTSGLSVDDFIHEVKVSVWVSPHRAGIAPTTYIVTHVMWTYRGLGRKKKEIQCSSLDENVLPPACTSKECAHIDNKDELGHLLKGIPLTDREASVLSELLAGKSLTETGKAVGVSIERVRQIRKKIIFQAIGNNHETISSIA